MNIGEIYSYVNFLLNKYQSGSYSPAEFNELLAATYLDPLKIKIGLPEEYQYPNKYAAGSEARQNYQASQTITDYIAPFIVTVTIPRGTNGFFPRPADYIRYSGGEYDFITTVDECGTSPLVEPQPLEPVTDSEKKFRSNNTIIFPDNQNPIISFEDRGFQILPNTITTFRLTYIRRPLVPVFGYTIDPQTLDVIYDPTTSVQLEYPDIVHNDYCAMLLKYIGLNIRDEDAIGFGEKRQMQGQ